MNREEMKKLNDGDTIRNKANSEGYMVLQNKGTAIIAVRAIKVFNPQEWEWNKKPGKLSKKQKTLTEKDIANLPIGRSVRHVLSKRVYKVIDNSDNWVTAIDLFNITDPSEWDVVRQGQSVTNSRNMEF